MFLLYLNINEIVKWVNVLLHQSFHLENKQIAQQVKKLQGNYELCEIKSAVYEELKQAVGSVTLNASFTFFCIFFVFVSITLYIPLHVMLVSARVMYMWRQ